MRVRLEDATAHRVEEERPDMIEVQAAAERAAILICEGKLITMYPVLGTISLRVMEKV